MAYMSANRIQSAYVDLYSSMREYVWDINVIERLAELEIEVYRTFPDIGNIRKAFNELLQYVHGSIASEDEDFMKSFNDFNSLIQDGTDIFCELNKFKKVVTYETGSKEED